MPNLTGSLVPLIGIFVLIAIVVAVISVFAAPSKTRKGQASSFKFKGSQRDTDQYDEENSVDCADENKINDDAKDAYEHIGTYSNSDAKTLLDAFAKHGIRFDVAVDASRLKAMTAAEAYTGGTFGQGTSVAIAVHADDAEETGRILQRIFKIEV